MDIPIVSTDYETDLKMIEYCNNNPDDTRCRCIKPPEKLYLFAKSSLVPYYCWYAPCSDEDVFKTFELVEEKKLCKLNLCEIKIDDIYVKDGIVRVENDCSSTINPYLQIGQVVVSLNNIDIPNMFISFIIPIVLCILILLWDGIEIKFNSL